MRGDHFHSDYEEWFLKDGQIKLICTACGYEIKCLIIHDNENANKL